MLRQWQILTVSTILREIDELFSAVRSLIRARLAMALGADYRLTRRIALRQAIAEVTAARAEIIEVLGDDHLG